MEDDRPKIGAYLSVFEEKLKKLKNNIKKELEKDKNNRNSAFLKQQLKEAKQLKKAARGIKQAAAELEHKISCPSCGTEFICDQLCNKDK